MTVDTSLTLTAAATPTAPALQLRAWCADDAPGLVAAYLDPALRRWGAHVVEDDADGLRWVQAQQRGWESGDRFAFAVLETAPGGGFPRLAGNVVLKDVAPDKPSAEVGYWTTATSRGHGIAPRALAALSTWALSSFRAQGLERLELLHQEDNATA
jgi:RimJ/RimL family protein N-acetyltransferase